MVLAHFLYLLLKQFFSIEDASPPQTNWLFLVPLLFSGCAYSLCAKTQWQISFFYEKRSPKLKSVINLVSALLFILPFVFFIFGTSWHYLPSLLKEVNVSTDAKIFFYQPEIRQISAYLYVALIFIGTQLLALAGISQICKAVLNIKNKKRQQQVPPKTVLTGSAV